MLRFRREGVVVCNADVSVRELPSTARGDLIRRRRDDILAAAARHGASNVRLFGSTARGDDRSDSDIDFLVHLGPKVGLFGIGRLEEELESLLFARVQIIPDEGLKPYVAASVEQDSIFL